MYKTILVIIIFLGCIAASSADLTPYGIKLALTQQGDEMKVTWITYDQSNTPTVLYSRGSFSPDESSSSGAVYPIESCDGAFEAYPTLYWKGHSNQAVMKNLSDWTSYFYYVGDKETNTWSPMFNFSTRSRNTALQFAVYGDMGHGGQGIDRDENYTLSHVLERQGDYDFVLHVGDIAYADLHSEYLFGNQTIWDEFLNEIQPLSTVLPYMVCPGNHDMFSINSEVYRKTFYMPSEKLSDSWYSFDYANVHLVGFSSEHDYIPTSVQYRWLENELKTYREKNPNGWLIVYSHRPFYCSSVYQWCGDADIFKIVFFNSLEKLMYKYNVDIYLSGHAHSYERTLPVYNNQVMGSYDSPKATVHILVGTGGNVEGPNYKWQTAPTWSQGPRFSSTGFGTISIINSETIQWNFIDNESNSVIDSMTITKGYF